MLQRKVETWLSVIFEKHGQNVGRHPYIFIIVPLILTAGFAYGLSRLRFNDDAEALNIASDSLWAYERRVYTEFLQKTTQPYIYDLTITRRDGANMLRPASVAHVRSLYDFSLNHLSISFEGATYTFANICTLEGVSCTNLSKPFEIFARIVDDVKLRLSPEVKLQYPVGSLLGYPLNLLGVLSNETLDFQRRINGSHALHVVFVATIDRNSTSKAIDILWAFGREFAHHFYSLNDHDEEYNYYPYHERSFTDAMTEATYSAMPLVAVSIGCLVAFTVFSSFTGNWRTSKPLVSLAGILNPLMAMVTGVGLLNLCGDYGWNSATSAMPFLVLAIGVDDMFVLIANWRNTNVHETAERRMAIVAREGGLAVCVTCATNVISFATGATQSTLSAAIVCSYISVCLSIEFAYQVTFFLGVLVLSGRREELDEKPKKQFCKVTCPQLFGPFTKILLNPITKISACVLYAIYVGVALKLCTTVRADMTSLRVMNRDSDYYDIFRHTDPLFSKYQLETVVVNAPPDFNNRTELQQFLSFVDDLENIPHYSVGPKATELWIRSLLDFRADKGDDENDFYETMSVWLEIEASKIWKSDLIFTSTKQSIDTSINISSFAFRVCFTNLTSVSDHRRLIQARRQLTNIDFSYLNASIFNFRDATADQTPAMIDNVMQDTGVAILAILGIAMLMVPDKLSMFWVAYFLLTIEAGVIAALKVVLNADIDFTTTVTIPMSVGFSVDFLLHASHAFRLNMAENEFLTVTQGLRAVAWPIIQSSIATGLGTIGLAFAKNYISLLFFTAVLAVVSIGALHTLCVFPIVFVMTSTAT